MARDSDSVPSQEDCERDLLWRVVPRLVSAAVICLILLLGWWLTTSLPLWLAIVVVATGVIAAPLIALPVDAICWFTTVSAIRTLTLLRDGCRSAWTAIRHGRW